MSALTISGSSYTITGTVKNQTNNAPIADLHVLVYDQDLLKDDFLGIGVTDEDGIFSVTFEASKFESLFDWWPDVYFIIKDGGFELLSTINHVRKDMSPESPDVNLLVDLSNDKLRQQINKEAVPGWIGGFKDTNDAFSYPKPNLSSLDMLDNLDNIDKLQRQQKVLWPEFSWNTEPEAKGDKKRCYQMFAPDISRLGYTNEGRVYSIICPQQGTTLANFGTMNVEVTVTGNRGWADEENRTLAADMSVVGKIWFSPSAKQGKLVRLLLKHFEKNGLTFPSSKAEAIVVTTFKPGEPSQPIFPLRNGLSTDFPIPEFAKHRSVAWTKGHLGVEIGPIKKTGDDTVDSFNQLILDLFNTGSGNMLKEGNILTWNVWFTAPEHVDQEEWRDHAEKWRKSIDADHGSPEGPGTVPRFLDGTPFNPLEDALTDELPEIIQFIKTFLKDT